MLIECPGNVLADQGRSVVLPLAQRLYDALGRRRIAQRYRDIAQPAFIADAAQRRALGSLQIGAFVPEE